MGGGGAVRAYMVWLVESVQTKLRKGTSETVL